ncbi:MAG: glycosyltransferase family 2 protein [Fimbriimonadaceae bacterium]|nr:glycosyltransferase family 2 protein [Fimbriimonadaceae bacterium]
MRPDTPEPGERRAPPLGRWEGQVGLCPSVSVVVVSFNTRDKLDRCLRAIEPHHEVIVVDNASEDGSPEMVEADHPRARLIRNETNRGFGAANNQGIDLASNPLVLLLNSDAYAEPGAIDRLAESFQDDAVVAAGGRLLNPDGSLQNSSANALTLWAVFCEQTLLEKAWPGSPVLSPYWNTRDLVRRLDENAETEQVMGACLMMRPVERFDERFFLYCEDTDLCRRLRRHGRIVYVPRAVFVHELGSSSGVNRWRAVARYNRGKELYFRIHHGRPAAFVCWLLDRMGAALRWVAWLIPCLLTLGLVGRFRNQVGLFARVLLAPVKGPDAR